MGHIALDSARTEGGKAFGGWVTLNCEAIPGIFERAGYDFVGIDCQHGMLSETDAANMVRRMGSARQAVLVRVSHNSPALIGKVLDAGADGVIVPLVSTAEEARSAVAACQYPPQGIRSFGPSRPDLPYSIKELQERVSCYVMIETTEGLDNAEQICAVPGLAGIIIGPGDLSVSLGLEPLQGFTSDQLFAAIGKVRVACESNGIALGIFAGGGAGAAKWISQGAQLIIAGSDIGMLSQASAKDVAVSRSESAAVGE